MAEDPLKIRERAMAMPAADCRKELASTLELIAELEMRIECLETEPPEKCCRCSKVADHHEYVGGGTESKPVCQKHSKYR